MENKMEAIGILYRDYRIYWGNIGIMEKNMETIGIIGVIVASLNHTSRSHAHSHFLTVQGYPGQSSCPYP